ncbi:hypothetical protein C2S51_017644 [Perilla frutescens var. frutescens]|nr:hypothetical protein C2S51_017644 [Perilla frutescens var. frutescens]
MQSIKCRSDELATLGKPLDQKDLIEIILEGLDNDYRHIVDIVDSREMAISFEKLHEKLINPCQEPSHTAAYCPMFQLVPAAGSRHSQPSRPTWQPFVGAHI